MTLIPGAVATEHLHRDTQDPRDRRLVNTEGDPGQFNDLSLLETVRLGDVCVRPSAEDHDANKLTILPGADNNELSSRQTPRIVPPLHCEPGRFPTRPIKP